MKQLITILIIACFASCQQSEKVDPYEVLNKSLDSLQQTANKVAENSRNQTNEVNELNIQLLAQDSAIKILLFTYYKAGWMAASNGAIGLFNTGKFTDGNITKIKNADWRAIEKDIASRK